MIIDAQNVLAGSYASGTWTGASVGTTAATAVVGTNVLDTTSTNTLKDLGSGNGLYLVVQVVTQVTSSAGCNITFKLASDSTTNLATSPTTHWTSGAIAKATLAPGYIVGVFELPRGKTYERYLGMLTTPDTTDATGGTYIAFLTSNPEVYSTYAKNYTIS